MGSVVQISEKEVRDLLTWREVIDAVECALEGVARGWVSQSSLFSNIGNTGNFMIILSAYFAHDKYGGIAYKLITEFPRNDQSIFTHIALMNENTGELKSILFGNDITEWRTAAASVVATTYLHGVDCKHSNKILAICGAGGEGRSHAVALQTYFHFEQYVRCVFGTELKKRAENLVKELNAYFNKPVFVVSETVEKCVNEADVIVTATTSEATIVRLEWVKKGAHINAIGVNTTAAELDEATYKAGFVYVDSLNNAKLLLKHIQALGVEFKGQIGDLITGSVTLPDLNQITIFQSLGMGSEDCAVARMVYDLYMKKNKCDK